MRVVMANLKAAVGVEEVNLRTLPRLVAVGPSPRQLARMLSSLPPPGA
jgi:hypothetical protein